MSMAIVNSKTGSLPEETLAVPFRSRLIGEVKELWGLGTSKGGSKPSFFFPWFFPLKTYLIFVETKWNQQKYPEMIFKSFHRNWKTCVFFQLKFHYSLKIHFEQIRSNSNICIAQYYHVLSIIQGNN